MDYLWPICKSFINPKYPRQQSYQCRPFTKGSPANNTSFSHCAAFSNPLSTFTVTLETIPNVRQQEYPSVVSYLCSTYSGQINITLYNKVYDILYDILYYAV